MRKKAKYIEAESHEGLINLTPLIDVVFAILIMFIIVAPLLEIDSIHLSPGPTQKKLPQISQEEVKKIVIKVYRDNTVRLNDHVIEMRALPSLLKSLKTLAPHQTPQLIQDKEAFFGTYQEIKNAVEDAGFEELEVVLNPHAVK